MIQQTGETCVNCHKLVRTYRFSVMVVQATKTTTYPMQMCAECARQLIDVIYVAADMKVEVTDAS